MAFSLTGMPSYLLPFIKMLSVQGLFKSHPSNGAFCNPSHANHYSDSAAAVAAKSLRSDSVRPHRWQCTRLRSPWDSPGKNTGVGCHFLLQCMIVKSESEVTQSFPTLSDPMDCSLPGSSVHGSFQARVLEWGAMAFSNSDSTHTQLQLRLLLHQYLEFKNTLFPNTFICFFFYFNYDNILI